MAKQTINNGESGLVSRGKLNDNFTELYNAKISGLTSGGVAVATSAVTIETYAGLSWDDVDKALNISDGTNTISIANDIISINATQIAYLPDQSLWFSSLFIGDGGQFLTHVNGTDGYDNTGVGIGAGFTNSRGYRNTFVGGESGYLNTTGSNNTAIGFQSMYQTTSVAQVTSTPGSNNVAIGAYSLSTNEIGQGNSAVGSYALRFTTGDRNTGIGYHSLYGTTIGTDNTGIGHDVAIDLTSGSNNSILGRASGAGIITGSGNTIVGANVGGLSSTLTNNIILANGTGAIKAQHDGANWSLNGALSLTTPLTAGNGGTGSTAFTQGSVPFIGASGQYQQNNSNLFWDNSSIELGIGTNNPLTEVHIEKSKNGSTHQYIFNPSTGSAAEAGLMIGQSNSGGAYTLLRHFGANSSGSAGYNGPLAGTLQNNSGGGLNLVAFGSSPGVGIYAGSTSTAVVRVTDAKLVGIGLESGSITASTRLDVRGVASNNITRFADDSNVQKFLFKTNGDLQVDKTMTAAGTTGAQTINKISGSVNFAAGQSTLVVTNSLATTSSNILVVVYGTDATATSARVTKANGSFTITLNAVATAETAVGFFIIN